MNTNANIIDAMICITRACIGNVAEKQANVLPLIRSLQKGIEAGVRRGREGVGKVHDAATEYILNAWAHYRKAKHISRSWLLGKPGILFFMDVNHVKPHNFVFYADNSRRVKLPPCLEIVGGYRNTLGACKAWY